MTWRSRKLLDTAKDVPYCMCCGKFGDGTITMAHSNQIRDGKGKGIKASDYRIATLCFQCHWVVDDSSQPREMKLEMWERAHRATIGWLFEAGIIGVINGSKA